MIRLRILLGIMGLVSATHAQDIWQLRGSTTVGGVLNSHQAQLEARIGRKVEITVNASALGLASLAAGQADFAMVSGSVEETVERVNAKHPGLIDLAALHVEQIGDSSLVALVNPKNPVRSLSSAQLGDILSGKITNWQQVGGSDAPIEVVSVSESSAFVRDRLLHGTAVTANARLVPSAGQIAPLVAERINAIGIVSGSHPRARTSRITLNDGEAGLPLYLITKGTPSADHLKLIQAARELMGTAP